MRYHYGTMDTTDCCHVMSHSHTSKDLKRKKKLKLNFEKNASLTAVLPKT